MTRLRIPLSCLLVVVILPALTFAQQPPKRDHQAIALLQPSLVKPLLHRASHDAPSIQEASIALLRSCTMMGSGFAKANTFLLTGQIWFLEGTGTLKGDVTIKFSGIGKARTDLMVESKSYSVIENAGKAHVIRDGKTQRLPLHTEFHSQSPYLPALFKPCDSDSSSHQATAVTSETINGEAVNRVRLERDFANRPKDKADILKALSRIDLYLNPSTSLVVRRSQVGTSQINVHQTWQVDYEYSDYRAVAGVLVPHRITQYVNGQKVSEITITSVIVNAGVTDADFEVR